MSELEIRRLEITDGFEMLGFEGRYFMWPEEYWLLSKYLDMTRGDYLEIGSMCGIIAMSFAQRYPRRQFVCVDMFSEGHATIAGNREIFFQNLREHNLQNVTLLEGNSLEVLPKISRRFDIVFVDANHAYQYVLGDASNSWPLLLPEGYIAFHDYGYVEETTRAVDDFLTQSGGRFVESSSSLAIIQKQATRMRNGLHNYMRTRYDELVIENESLRKTVDKMQNDLDWLLASIKTHENESAQLAARKQELETILGQIQNSTSWRILNRWRKMRNRLAPETSWHRRRYDSLLRVFRGSD